MKLFIKIENGVPVNHPAYEDNLVAAFGGVPEDWELFERVEKPEPPLYKAFDDPEFVYEKVNGVWTDVWRFRDMTDAEKTHYQDYIKLGWSKRRQLENFAAWVFDEVVCDYVPPFPKPNDGKDYFWQGVTSSWVEKPQCPDDGKMYKLNFTLGVWEEVTN